MPPDHSPTRYLPVALARLTNVPSLPERLLASTEHLGAEPKGINMDLTGRNVHIEPSHGMYLDQHFNGLHEPAELDCPICTKDARETPDDIASTSS